MIMIIIIIVSLLDISRDAKSLIKGLLTVDQSRRLTIDQAISHPWYENVNDNFIFSSLLIQHIFKSRLRISNNNISYSNKQNKTFKRDTKFSVTSIILSIIYAILTLPNSIDVFFNNYYLYITYPAFLFLFYSSYAVNFYIIILTNSFVRNEFFIFFKSKKSLPTNGVNGTIRI